MKSTQTITGQIPWRVGVSVVTEHPIPEYVGERQVPHTLVSQGYVLAHGFDIYTARQRAERIIRAMYKEPLLSIGFFNTEPWSNKENSEQTLAGLTFKV